VAIVPAAGEGDTDAEPTRVMELPSILEDDDEDVTAISVRGSDLERASEPPDEEVPPAADPPDPEPADAEPLSTRTVHPITRTVPPSRAPARGLNPLMLVAGVAVAALSSAATTWLSQPEAPAARECDCSAEVQAATTACDPTPTRAPAPPVTVASEASAAPPPAPLESASAPTETSSAAPKQLVWPAATKPPAPTLAEPAPPSGPKEKPAAAPAPDDNPYPE
jgi:hypothetical protein